MLDPGEQCDDGNTLDGDCCSFSCQEETGCEVEPNDSVSDAAARAEDATPIRFQGSGFVKGALSPLGDMDTYQLSLSQATNVVRFEAFDGTGSGCGSGMATQLYLYDEQGITLKGDTDGGIDACSALVLNLPSGGYFLRLMAPQNMAMIPLYVLEIAVLSNAGTEKEPNDTMAQARSFPGLYAFMAGSHPSASDIDYYKITIPGISKRSVRAEIIEGSFESCESDGIRSRLTLLDAKGTTLADDDAGRGRGSCSKIDGTGASAADPGAHDLSPGTYYLRVQAASGAGGQGAIFDYKLAITVR